MNRKFCDRCGKEINTNPMMQCQNPLFEIRQLYPQGILPIDLCEDCSKKFVEWIRRNNAPTVEAIPKDQYKAEMVAMLEELDFRLSNYQDTDLIRQDIQEKINSLKENTDGNK